MKKEGHPKFLEFEGGGGEYEYFGTEKDDAAAFFISKRATKCEIPGAGMSSNARTLAKLAAFMANKGSLDGKCLMSPEAWESSHQGATASRMSLFQMTCFT